MLYKYFILKYTKKKFFYYKKTLLNSFKHVWYVENKIYINYELCSIFVKYYMMIINVNSFFSLICFKLFCINISVAMCITLRGNFYNSRTHNKNHFV